MAVVNWTGGGVDTSWQTAGNWDTGVPSAGDDVVINTGAKDITVGPASAINLDSLYIGPKYRGTITALIALGTVGNFRYESGGPSGRFNLTAATANVHLAGSRSLSLEGGSYGSAMLGVRGGRVVAHAGAVLVNISSAHAAWTVYGNATGITSFTNVGGTVEITSRNITGVYTSYSSGLLRLLGTAGFTSGSSTAVANIGPGTRLNLEGTSNQDILNALGTVDLSGMRDASTINTLRIHPTGGYVGSSLATFTNLLFVGASGSSTGAGALPVP